MFPSGIKPAIALRSSAAVPLLWTGFFLTTILTLPLRAGDLSPDELLKDAWKQYRLGEFNLAVREFQALQKKSAPGSETELQGLYGEAACWNFRGDSRDPRRSIPLYEDLIQKSPRHALAPWAALDSVRARFLGVVDAFGKTSEVVEAYQNVYNQYPDSAAGEEAFVFQANLRAQEMDVAQAHSLLASINTFLQGHPDSHLRSFLYDLQGQCFGRLDRQKERLACMIRSLETREFDTSNPLSNFSQQYWEIAYAAEFEAGNFAIAREYYGRLIKEYPGNLRIFGAKEALLRMDLVEKTIREGSSLPPNLLPKALP